MKFVSIIYTHWAQREERSQIMRASIESLIESIDYPTEIIVIDNGEDLEDSAYLLGLCAHGQINTYVRNQHNMHFAWARNQGIAIANGDYIAISDNDIIYEKGWLSKCVDILDAYPDRKIYATPFCDKTHKRHVFWSGELKHKGETYRLNMRAGSNCFVARRNDFAEIGIFPNHRIAGTKWTNRAVKLKYLAAVVPGDLAKDAGFRRGYNLKHSHPVKLDLKKGEVYYNRDEFIKVNPNVTYKAQMTSCRSFQ